MSVTIPLLPPVVLALLASAWIGALPGDPASDEDAVFFTQQVRPVLEARCFECHGAETRRPKGKLRLDSRQAVLTGGREGPAAVPGDPDASLLITAVRRTEFDFEMPPKEVMPPGEVAVLEEWVRRGLPWDDQDGRPAGHDASTEGRGADAPLPAPDFTREQLDAFETDVRPLLVERCGECHGADVPRPKGGLRMGWRGDLLHGGDSGPALTPGDPGASRLMEAVSYGNADLQMPPDGRLSPREVDTLRAWIAQGAPWPPSDEPGEDSPLREGPLDLEAGRTWWSFQPVVRPPVPAGDPHPIDAFLDAALAREGLTPNPPADPRTLARRTWFDLVGLPPSAGDLDAFAADDRDDAHERLADDLLARPEYGERWARHWLDLVRFAQTSGYEVDPEKPFIWRYRDWVIDAFNADMPYDRFLAEQLAGDELDDVTDSSLVATGFYRLGVWDREPDDRRQAEFDELDDIVTSIGSGMLGVTLSCARCHDHKFDPFGQDDYYAMVAMLRGLEPNTDPRYALGSATLQPLGLDQPSRKRWEQDRDARIGELEEQRRALLDGARRGIQVARLPADAPAALRRAVETPVAGRDPAQRRRIAERSELSVSVADLTAHLDDVDRQRARDLFTAIEDVRRSFAGDLAWAQVARERRQPPPETHVLSRGRASRPGPVVPPRFVRVLCEDDGAAAPELAPPRSSPKSTGRRRALAEWIASPDHPLTARVIVNRVWQHHFGRGLVPTPNDFGAAGLPPSHPELLDWLAAELVDHDWSLKHLHRLILSSRAWQRSSDQGGPNAERAREVDPDNALLWRQNLRRLEAEPLRDAIVSVSGGLSPERGGRGFFPTVSREALAGSSAPGRGWAVDLPEARDRRAIYAYVKRSLLPPVLEAFDYTNTSLPVGARVDTTSVSQAFVLLNGAFAERQSERLTAAVLAEAEAEPRARVSALFERVLSRAPDDAELTVALEYLAAQERAFADLTSAAVFAPLVPRRVDEVFLAGLEGRHVLSAPSRGWTVLTGPWGNMYNNTVEIDTARGPAALLDGVFVADVTVRARLRCGQGADPAALLVRATPHGSVFTGLALQLEASTGRVALVLHDDPEQEMERARRPRILIDATRAPFVGEWVDVTLSVEGDRLRSTVTPATGPPVTLEARAPGGPARGTVGVSAWGGPFELASLELSGQGQQRTIELPSVPADERALRSLALTLLNTNEFVFVD